MYIEGSENLQNTFRKLEGMYIPRKGLQGPILSPLSGLDVLHKQKEKVKAQCKLLVHEGSHTHRDPPQGWGTQGLNTFKEIHPNHLLTTKKTNQRLQGLHSTKSTELTELVQKSNKANSKNNKPLGDGVISRVAALQYLKCPFFSKNHEGHTKTRGMTQTQGENGSQQKPSLRKPRYQTQQMSLNQLL